MKKLIDKLENQKVLSKKEFTLLFSKRSSLDEEYLFQRAREVREIHYGNHIYIRGLIEIGSYCKNDCYYCGIRCSNAKAQRYRLTKEQILECCYYGYELGFRTFVLQGGEDPFFTREFIVETLQEIKSNHPKCAVTLSIGERSKEDYQAFKTAGADRYLLRHETGNKEHYDKLHPETLTLKNRQQCIEDLKEIGFQVGTGFMVGSPYQQYENLAEDFLYIHKLQPDMVGIGPFLPHKDTPLGKEASGTAKDTVFALGILRLMLPFALLPSTTALATLDPNGRQMGFDAGANVTMPNLSPKDAREKYSLYNNKKHSGGEDGAELDRLKKEVSQWGYQIVVHRGDVRK